MTTTHDPQHPSYTDESDVRGELSRVFDVCHGCRRCVSLCTSFPTLFEMIDRFDDHDAGRMTPAQQDRIVDECFQCKLCAVDCPYTPELHESNVDFPRLMLRADAMLHDNGHRSARSKVLARLVGRTDLLGRLATTASPLANRIVAAEPGSLIRKLNAMVTGLTATRRLPPYARQRFSTWFDDRPKIKIARKQAEVTVFPTCLVEYHDPDIGKDLVKVYERNGIECNTTVARCCGAPSLHAGDIERFAEIAEHNVEALAAEIRTGTDVVVPQPACSYVLKQHYPDHVAEASKADARLVAAHTYDAAEYLMTLHQGDDYVLDTNFDGEVPVKITYHTPSHLRARNVGFKSRDLLKLTGARVKLVQQGSGIDGLWGLRAEHDDIAIPIARQLGEQITRADGDVVAGDCLLANTAIVEQTGAAVQHPLQIVARAYGIPEDT